MNNLLIATSSRRLASIAVRSRCSAASSIASASRRISRDCSIRRPAASDILYLSRPSLRGGRAPHRSRKTHRPAIAPGRFVAGEEAGKQRFIVHPRGYAVFHVSSGAGGYHVNIRRGTRSVKCGLTIRARCSRRIFSPACCCGLAPTRYAICCRTRRRSDRFVSVNGETAYRPPAPTSVEVGETIEPRRLELRPAQGFNMHVKVPARIKIELRNRTTGRHEAPGGRPPGLAASPTPGKKE